MVKKEEADQHQPPFFWCFDYKPRFAITGYYQYF